MSDAQNIKVSVRCRPLRSDEKPAPLQLDSSGQSVTVENKEFQFDNVFDIGAPQEDVYHAVVKPLIPQVLQGYDCSVLAYGQTGTGKTYTMEGPDNSGIIPKSVSHIFKLLRDDVKDFNVKISFLELYSEDVYDLLSSSEDTTKLRIFDDKKDEKKRSVKIEGLTEVSVESESDIIEMLSRGSLRRQTTATLLNACSSRSHSIFTISVEVRNEIQGREIRRIGKLNLVDLAGSESIARSGALNKHAREAGNINQSLLTLTRVITALAEKRQHVPYRESKLTRILQDSLGGATRTSMIATISPAYDDIVNTIGTLEYASSTRRLKNRPDCNRQLGPKISQDLEEYKINFEASVRAQVVSDFREEVNKIEMQHKKNLEEKDATIKDLNKELKILRFMLKEEKELVEKLRIDFKMREEELLKELLKSQKPATPPPSKMEDDDYVNMTFTGDDEIVQVSAVKKRRKHLADAPKIHQDLTLSGKKKRLKNYGGNIDLSPISPPVRVTRSRSTRRKLQY